MRRSIRSSKNRITSKPRRTPIIPSTNSSSVGRIAFSEETAFNGVKVFSATMVMDREQLGEKITEWLHDNPKLEVREVMVTQSSDEAFHCIAITLFYWEPVDTRSARKVR